MDECTAWELMAAVEGWKSANCPEDGPAAPTDEEHDALVAKHG